MTGVNFKVLQFTLCLLAIAAPTDSIHQSHSYIGDHLFLGCLVGHVQNYSVSFVKINKERDISEVLTDGSSVITKDPRVSLNINSNSHIYSLVINDLQESDAGVYQCEITHAGSFNDDQKLEVLIQKRRLPLANSTSSTGVQEGGSNPTDLIHQVSAYIGEHWISTCSIGHVHDYSVSFVKINKESNISEVLTAGSSVITKDPRVFLNINSKSRIYVLVIKDLQESDAGVYQCEITHAGTLNDDQKLELLIQKRRLPLANSTTTTGVQEGGSNPAHSIHQINSYVGTDLLAGCLVGHVQDYSVSFVKINKESNIKEILTAGSSVITKDPRVSLNINSNSHIYTLVIKNLQESDAGVYQCQITHAGTLNDDQRLQLLIQKRRLPLANSTSSAGVKEGGYNVQQTPLTTLKKHMHNETHVKLNCMRGHALDYSISWVRFNAKTNTSEILTAGPSLITKDPRFSMEAEFAKDTHKINYKLFIRDFIVKDADAYYDCKTFHSAPIFGVPVKATEAGKVKIQQTVSINSISSKYHVTGHIGHDVQLNCTVGHVQNYSVTWVKINKESNISEALTAGCSLITKDPRFSLEVDCTLNIYKLLIKDLQEPDAGFYQCLVILAGTHKTNKELELRLQKPPLSLANSTSSAVIEESLYYFRQTPSTTTVPTVQHPTLYKGTDVQFNCTFQGTLDYSKTWIRKFDGSPQSETLTVGPNRLTNDGRFSLDIYFAMDTHKINYNLLIKDFGEKDKDYIYRCVTSFNTQLSIANAMLTPEKVLTTLTGRDAEYTCRVQFINNTYPDVNWVKINKTSNITETLTCGSCVITKNPRISLEVDSSLDTNIFTYKLRIKNLQKPDDGIYQCQVFSSESLWIIEHLELQLIHTPTHHAIWDKQLTLLNDTDHLPEFW